METFIEIDINAIKKAIPRGEMCCCLVVKSNFYGYGYAMISYIDQWIDYIVVASVEEMNQVKLENPGIKKEFIILYSNLNDINTWSIPGVYGVIMSNEHLDLVKNLNLDCSRFYIRGEQFLGLHGLDLATCMREVKYFKGFIIHINEYLNEEEIKKMLQIDKMLCRKKLTLNIGGSIAIEYINKLTTNIEYRFCRNILFGNAERKSNFQLHIQVISEKQAHHTTVGYKSCQAVIKKGWIYLIAIGYGTWSLLSRIYETQTEIPYYRFGLVLPVYPCMSTCWVYSETQLSYSNGEIILFKYKEEIQKVCQVLDIDEDEFTSSFSSNIRRKYYYKKTKNE